MKCCPDRIITLALVLAGLMLRPVTPASATDNKTGETSGTAEVFSTTLHTVHAARQKIRYTATAGQLVLTDDDGMQKAHIFFIAYEKKGAPADRRPITFAFNGGPGSSSVWLHMGALGPRRVVLNDDGSVPPPPAVLTDNEFSWLAFTDLVFIDPVGTGYSRPLVKQKKKKFYGFKKDIESVGDFIRLYLTRYNRWGSPKCIVGESYGTTRAVGLADYVHKQHGIDVNGIVLVSPVLEFNTILFNTANDLPYMLIVPSYAAAARYHNKLPSQTDTVEHLLAEAEHWTMQEYLQVLAQGAGTTAEQRTSVATRMAASIGVSREYILANNMRIPEWRFRKEIMRDQHRIIGRMDARLAGPDTDTAGEAGSYDPSLEPLVGLFAGAINHYIRNDLKFESDTPYKYINYTVNSSWDWSSGIQRGQGYVNVAQTLTEVIHKNPHVGIFIASGYYDLATPYFAVQYTVKHLELDEALRKNIVFKCYHAGHMPYTDLPSLKKFTEDAARFYEATLAD